MTSSDFLKTYARLNPEQKQAVDAIEGPVMVVAGPGTGKTQILTLRIANILLKTQINPENILALTFSEAASLEMRKRLVSTIGGAAFRVEISTFHSFANSIIQDYPEEFGRLISSDSISEDEQIEFIEKIIDSIDLDLLRPWGDQFFYVKDILTSINQLKKEGINSKLLEEALKKQKEDFKNVPDLYHEKGQYKGNMKGKYQDMQKDMEKLNEFIRIFEEYENLLSKNKKYDYSDMLVEVVKVLESNKSLLLLLQEKYQYILVDEHQDTNASQNKLVELISSFYEIPNLFVVGDEKQSIYRFQGASIENFLYFRRKYAEAKLINLSQNYRSHQIILDAAVSFISNNISASILTDEIKLEALEGRKAEKIKIAALDDYFGEFEFVAQQVEKLIKSGVKAENIAVLGRRNLELSEVAEFLEKKKIKAVIDSDSDVLADIWVKKLLLVLESVNDFLNEEKFAQILTIDILKIDPYEVFKLLAFSRKEKKSIFEILESKGSDFSEIRKFYSIYKGWITLSKNIQFDDLFIKIFNESGIRDGFLNSPDRNEIRAKFITLFESVKEKIYKNPDYSISQFIEKITLIKKHNLKIKSNSGVSKESGIRLLTAHKAKGQEFEYVFIIQCISGRWGSIRKRGEKIKIPWEFLGETIKTAAQFEAIEDERRLFFVGLTRAKKDIFLTYSKFSSELKEQLPSQFLSEINPELIEEINTNEFNNSFENRKDILFEESSKVFDKKIEQEFLSRIFLEKGLNVSAVDNFLECPWKYFFVNLISMPAVRNKYQLFGTAVHSSLENLIKNRKTEKSPQDYLLKQLEWNLSLQGLAEKDYKEYLKKGEKALSGFYKNVFINFSENIQSEINIRGIKISETLTLNGRIDMLEETSKGEFVVHDFKTGRAKTRNEINGSKSDTKNNYLRQLVFYKILLDRFKEGIFKTKLGAIDFIEADEKGKFKSEVFEISESDTDELLVMLESIAKQIYNLSFWDSACGVKNCEWCELRQMMS